jgi:hypothetical protein
MYGSAVIHLLLRMYARTHAHTQPAMYVAPSLIVCTMQLFVCIRFVWQVRTVPCTRVYTRARGWFRPDSGDSTADTYKSRLSGWNTFYGDAAPRRFVRWLQPRYAHAMRRPTDLCLDASRSGCAVRRTGSRRARWAVCQVRACERREGGSLASLRVCSSRRSRMHCHVIHSYHARRPSRARARSLTSQARNHMLALQYYELSTDLRGTRKVTINAQVDADGCDARPRFRRTTMMVVMGQPQTVFAGGDIVRRVHAAKDTNNDRPNISADGDWVVCAWICQIYVCYSSAGSRSQFQSFFPFHLSIHIYITRTRLVIAKYNHDALYVYISPASPLPPPPPPSPPLPASQTVHPARSSDERARTHTPAPGRGAERKKNWSCGRTLQRL